MQKWRHREFKGLAQGVRAGINDRAGTRMQAAWLLTRVSCISLKARVGIRIGLGQVAFCPLSSAVAAAPGDLCPPHPPLTDCWVGAGEAVHASARRPPKASLQVCQAGHASPALRAALTGLPGPYDVSVCPPPSPARFPVRGTPIVGECTASPSLSVLVGLQ